MRNRFIYMVVAIVATILLEYLPCLSFMGDKGILYSRTYTMNQHSFEMAQVSVDSNDGTGKVIEDISVEGLYYCYIALLSSCIACLLCFFNDRWRMIVAIITIIIAGLYYAILVGYIFIILDTYFASMYPNIGLICPAIVIQMMILVRRSILEEKATEDEKEDEAVED